MPRSHTDDEVSVGAARFLQRPLAKLISTLRAPKSSEGYKAIGGGSPLRRITEEQAAALAQSLMRRGLDASVYVGMRYWTPFIDDAMEQVRLLGLSVNDGRHVTHLINPMTAQKISNECLSAPV